MVAVALYQYTHYTGVPFNPGDEVVWWFGPWEWWKHGVVVTAHPFNASSSNRSLEVVHTRSESYPGDPEGHRLIVATVRNTGPDPIMIFYLTVTDIAP
ncbi:hypothetical protein ACLQ2Q_21370 [Microbacterium sp. DT81.1]|uniref:hypothetical protein n=1 Tax=Microbacterium sp. DT81.1 TaxID=3393413 RepID=UPI003CE9C626